MTCTPPMGLENQLWVAINDNLTGLNNMAPIASVSQSGSVTTITLKDGRTFTVTVTPGANPPSTATTQITSASSWTVPELNALHSLAYAVNICIFACGMTALTVTYV
jgi:hypothetical protein